MIHKSDAVKVTLNINTFVDNLISNTNAQKINCKKWCVRWINNPSAIQPVNLFLGYPSGLEI